MSLARLSLTNFRNHSDLRLEPGMGLVILTGENGAGKTNILEAISLLAPGRGLRGATLGEMARSDGPGGFGVGASLTTPLPLAGGAAPKARGGPEKPAVTAHNQAHPAADAAAHQRENRPPDGSGRSGGPTDPLIASGRGASISLGTGTLAAAPERRQVRINTAAAAANALADWLSVLWLTPAMDRLFTDSAGGRRRFLDRLTLALHPAHAMHAARYEAAMRARNKLLADEVPWDETWLDSLEAQMEDHGRAVSRARLRTIKSLVAAIWADERTDFPKARLLLGNITPGSLKVRLKAARKTHAAARRTLVGPNNEDLVVHYGQREMPAARSSTGEQKALLLGLILAHAELVRATTGRPLILLLDEVAAHLDPRRRLALFERLGDAGGQVWMTGTESQLFEGAAPATCYTLVGGRVESGS